MKTLRQLCLTLTLIFTFAFSAYAGEIECPGITSDAPQETVAGEIQNGVQSTETDTVTLTVLMLIQNVLALS